MLKRLRKFVPFLFVLALTVGVISLNTAHAQEPDKADDDMLEQVEERQAEVEEHCIAEAQVIKSEKEELDVEGKATLAQKPTCFKSFSQAIHAATGGAVNLPKGIGPEDLTQEMLDAAPNSKSRRAYTLIGVEYNWKKYRRWGGSVALYVRNSVGCSTGYSYSVSRISGWWNDRISSARAYGGCNHALHYQHAYFRGRAIDCGRGCRTMGSMNNRTSSIIWRR